MWLRLWKEYFSRVYGFATSILSTSLLTLRGELVACPMSPSLNNRHLGRTHVETAHVPVTLIPLDLYLSLLFSDLLQSDHATYPPKTFLGRVLAQGYFRLFWSHWRCYICFEGVTGCTSPLHCIHRQLGANFLVFTICGLAVLHYILLKSI